MKNEFKPDWASPPGYTILNILEEKNIGLLSLMEKLDIPVYDVYYLMVGKIPITGEMAQKLADFLGGSKAFWINREAQYRETLERLKNEALCKK